MPLYDFTIPLPENCIKGIFIRKINRFTVEARILDENVRVHCNNTGSLTASMREGMPVLLSCADKPGRKTGYNLERVYFETRQGRGEWCACDANLPNKLLKAAFMAKKTIFADNYPYLQQEKPFGQSRLDACFSGADLPDFWVECKSVTYVENSCAMFPDSPTERGQKHLKELINLAGKGCRSAMLYVVLREDARFFSPAAYIDQKYASLFWHAMEKGVEIYVWKTALLEGCTSVKECLPIIDIFRI